MGFTPVEVDKLSLWQFSAAWNGYVAANTPDSGKLTEREADALFDWIDVPTERAGGRLPNLQWTGRSLMVG